MYIVSSSRSELSRGSLSQNKAFSLHLFNFSSSEGGTGGVRGQSVGVVLSFQCVGSRAATWLSDLTNTLPMSHLDGCSVSDTETHKCPRFALYHCQKHTHAQAHTRAQNYNAH